MAVYYTFLWIGVLTALSWVVSLLGVVAMFVAVIVPFGVVPPLLNWLLKRGVPAESAPVEYEEAEVDLPF